MFQDVFFGIKFYGRAAHITMTIQAIVYAAFGIGILLHQRWGLILGLLYFAQVVIGHVIFFATNFNVPSQAVHVRITAIEGPIMFMILLYLWVRGRPLLVHTLAWSNDCARCVAPPTKADSEPRRSARI